MDAVLPITALGEGEMVACNVRGVEILVCRVEDEYFALSNHCSHAGQRLSTGRLRGFELSCPLHRAVFDVRTGAPLRAPAAVALARYPVLLANGKINVRVIP